MYICFIHKNKIIIVIYITIVIVIVIIICLAMFTNTVISQHVTGVTWIHAIHSAPKESSW